MVSKTQLNKMKKGELVDFAQQLLNDLAKFELAAIEDTESSYRQQFVSEIRQSVGEEEYQAMKMDAKRRKDWIDGVTAKKRLENAKNNAIELLEQYKAEVDEEIRNGNLTDSLADGQFFQFVREDDGRRYSVYYVEVANGQVVDTAPVLEHTFKRSAMNALDKAIDRLFNGRDPLGRKL